MDQLLVPVSGHVDCFEKVKVIVLQESVVWQHPPILILAKHAHLIPALDLGSGRDIKSVAPGTWSSL